MNINIESDNENLLRKMQSELNSLITNAGLQETLHTGAVTPQAPGEAHRGDLVTIFTVLMAAVSVGGALTVAMGKEGFLTQLAKVFEKYVGGGNIRVVLEEGDRKLEMEGGARRIERMFGEFLERIEQQRD